MRGVFGHDAWRDLLKETDSNRSDFLGNPNPLVSPSQSLFGIPVLKSNLFPFTNHCKECNGTGEGETSTYCPKCKGRGATQVEGAIMNGDQTILINGALPRKFEPSFPASISLPPKLSRGLI